MIANVQIQIHPKHGKFEVKASFGSPQIFGGFFNHAPSHSRALNSAEHGDGPALF